MGQLRIAPTISGAVSLGAYEGGAPAALLVAVQQLQAQDPEAIRIDPEAGAKPWHRVNGWERIQALGVAGHVARVAVFGSFGGDGPGLP